MAGFRSVDIDFDVHKCIELARESFAETPNAVLRRLLSIDAARPVQSVTGGGVMRAWSGKECCFLTVHEFAWTTTDGPTKAKLLMALGWLKGSDIAARQQQLEGLPEPKVASAQTLTAGLTGGR